PLRGLGFPSGTDSEGKFPGLLLSWLLKLAESPLDTSQALVELRPVAPMHPCAAPAGPKTSRTGMAPWFNGLFNAVLEALGADIRQEASTGSRPFHRS